MWVGLIQLVEDLNRTKRPNKGKLILKEDFGCVHFDLKLSS